MTKLKKYKSDLKAHEEKIEAGKKQVDELNARFNDWYYVISAENFNKLLIARKDFVKEKANQPATTNRKTSRPTNRTTRTPLPPTPRNRPTRATNQTMPATRKIRSPRTAATRRRMTRRNQRQAERSPE